MYENNWIVVCRNTENKTTSFWNLCFGIERNWRFVSALSRYFYELSMNMRRLDLVGCICVSVQASWGWWQPEWDIMQHCCVALIQTWTRCAHKIYQPTFPLLPYTLQAPWHLHINFVLSSIFYVFDIESPRFFFLVILLGPIWCMYSESALLERKMWKILLQWVFEYLENPFFRIVTRKFFFSLSKYNSELSVPLRKREKEKKISENMF